MERFACETVIISGEGALDALQEHAGKRLLMVTDRMNVPEGMAAGIRGMLKPKAADCLDIVAPEPTMVQAVDGAGRIKAFGPELVVAVGGTHVMDCAKAMVGFSRRSCCLVTIPTEASLGAEVTDRVVLTHDGRRHCFRNPGMRPDMAVLDSSFLSGCSPGMVAEGGFVILANSLQTYMGKHTGILTSLHAREAFSRCWGTLPAAFAGNAAAKERLQMASVMAGIAYDRAGLGLCHAMEDSLGVLFHLSRGKLAAILLPAVIGCNAHTAGRRLAELSRTAGLGGSSDAAGVRNLKTGLLRLRRELGLPSTLAQAGVNPRRVWSNAGRIAELTLENPECRNNPVTADDFLVRRILEEVTGHY